MSNRDRLLRQRFAHALMSPLTVILGSAEMLQTQAQTWPESSRELVDLILSQAKRLQETLNNLLDTVEIHGDEAQVTWSTPAASQPGAPPAAPDAANQGLWLAEDFDLPTET